MNPKIRFFDGRVVIGLPQTTDKETEANLDTAKLPAHWDKFFKNVTALKIPQKTDEDILYGVYHNFKKNHIAEYSLTISAAVENNTTPPKNMKKILIPQGEYLVFEVIGTIPHAVRDTWKKIFNYFRKSTYTRAYNVDFEMYTHDETLIYISIK